MRNVTLSNALFLAALLAALLAASAAAQGGNDDAREQAAHEERARAIIAELKALGFSVDPARVSIEVRHAAGAAEDMDVQQDHFFAPTYFNGMCRLFKLLGLSDADDAEEFRESIVANLGAGYSAYYHADRHALVFLDTAANMLTKALGGLDALIAHELVHAHQDQRFGLVKWLRGNQKTLDAVNVGHAIMEGEAEIVSNALVLAREEKTLADFDPEASNDLERLTTGIGGLVYGVGRSFLWRRHQEGGWKAVAAQFASPPTSTEQVMHEEKLGHDLPTAVTLPELDLPRIHDDVLGELAITKYLSGLGAKRRPLFLAATGWDGDRLSVHEGKDGAWAVMWRTVWDRPVDAEQMESALAGAGEARFRRVGAVLDIYGASSPELETTVCAALAAHPAPSAEKADAASTAAVEAAWLKRESAGPAAKNGRWVHERLGVSVPIPEGWSVQELNGVAMLMPEGSPFSNIVVNGQPNPTGLDLPAIMAQNKAAFKAMKLDPLRMEIVERQDREVIRYEVKGAMGGAVEVHITGIIFIQGKRIAVVSATTTETLWEKNRAALEGAVEGTVISAPR